MGENLKEKAYQLIKSRIISCEYPPNSFLSENDLILEIDASRTPIREALNKLEQERFVTIIPKKGVMVNGLTLQDIIQTFEVRILLEPYIIKNNIKKFDRDALIAIQDESQNMIEHATDPSVFRSLDDRLHRLFSTSQNNRYFTETLTHIFDQNQRIHLLSESEIYPRHIEAAKEHIELINYILDEKEEEAVAAITLHLIKSKDAAIQSLLK